MEFLICIVVLANMVAGAVACSRIAASKNRGSDEWFVVGEIFGVFAVPVVWLMRPLQEPRA